jgi:hypothetical protein
VRLRARIEMLVRKGDFYMALKKAATSEDAEFRDMIETLCFRRLLEWQAEWLDRALVDTLPTMDNLCALIEAQRDLEARELLRRGARLERNTARTRGVLLQLFASERMPRTIEYLASNNMLQLETLNIDHFMYSLCSPNVWLTRLLARQPAIRRALLSLSPARRANLQTLSMWWTARHLLDVLCGHEAMRMLMRSRNVAGLSDHEFIDLLRMFNVLTHIDDAYILERRRNVDASQYAFAMPLTALSTLLQNRTPSLHDLETVQRALASIVLNTHTSDTETLRQISRTIYIDALMGAPCASAA